MMSSGNESVMLRIFTPWPLKKVTRKYVYFKIQQTGMPFRHDDAVTPPQRPGPEQRHLDPRGARRHDRLMNGRDRILAALSFAPADRTPRDLGGMRSTGISAFAYGDLIRALGLPPRLPRVYDTMQMLALPDRDVLDALGCDVVPVEGAECTNAFDEPDRWHEFDFGGRLPALVAHPDQYAVLPDGTVTAGTPGEPATTHRQVMPPSSYVFDEPHGGQPLDLSAEPEREDLDRLADRLEAGQPSPARIDAIAAYCARARAATDRAIMFSGLGAGLGYPGGFPAWSVLCLTDPDYVHAYHDIVTAAAVRRIELILPRIAPYVDILMLSADDQGLQDRTILPPRIFRDLYVPYYRRVTDAVHASAVHGAAVRTSAVDAAAPPGVRPGVRTFLHSCGAVYDLIDDFVECGFDILNPVQWPAGGHTPAEWKARASGAEGPGRPAGRRLALWGGGVNTQATLPLGSIDDVRTEVSRTVETLAAGGGYVFAAIHNLLAEIPGEKVVAMYDAVV
ncbi:MAG: hypothetical protein EA382_10880 [Spirochaetaceae bacterium]|nr:MAG: hypothetical protein EA382_10880 [Spirochaetaceae bacterium]